MNRVAFGFLAAVVIASGTSLDAQERVGVGDAWRAPLRARNQLPTALFFAHLPPDRATVLAPGTMVWRFDFDYSNILRQSNGGRELLSFDAEYLRADLGANFGLPGEFELGVSVPGYAYTGGVLDPVIDGFHRLLGLATTVRSRTTRGQLRYLYRRDDTVFFEGNEPTSSIGDVSFELKRQMVRSGPYAVALRGIVKLPSGSTEQLSGSGAADYGVGVAIDRLGSRVGFFLNANHYFLGSTGALAIDRLGSRVGFFLNANHYFLGSTGALPARDYSSAMAGFDIRIWPRLLVNAQVDWMTPFLESDLREMQGLASQISFGMRFLQSPRFGYEWRFSEDLSRASPDFTFGFQTVMRLDRVPTPW